MSDKPLQIIRHRVNRISDLAAVRPEWGVEMDLRSDPRRPGHLYVAHDPWVEGDDFEAWLTEYVARGIQGPLILNTKEDNLETRVLELLQKHGVRNHFFLDTALPTLVKWTQFQGRREFAVRLSKFEPVESCLPFAGKADWVWVDCFEGNPMVDADSLSAIDRLKAAGFRVCLVSPELQGQPIGRVAEFAPLRARADAVCTKQPQAWTG